MAARFCDSFDAYLTADLLLRWTAQYLFNSATTTISASNGRNGTSSLRTGPTNSNQGAAGVGKTLGSQATWIVGFAFRTPTLNTNPTIPFASLDDGFGTHQIELSFTSGGFLRATRNGTLLGTATSVPLVANTYAYVELLGTIDATAGVVTIRVNGAQVLALTGQNTKNTANASADTIVLGMSAGVGPGGDNWDYDDLYVLDGTGAANNTFLGDTRVQALRSTGAGHSTQFALGAGTSNWEAVSEATEDGDTTYVDSATAGQIDAYTFGALTPVSGTIPFLQTMLVARKDDAGIRTVADVISDGITDHVGASNNVGTSYQQWLTIHETDPVTSAAFTLANVNARQYGVEEVA